MFRRDVFETAGEAHDADVTRVTPDRATPLRVFGVAAGLLVIVGLAMSLARPRGEELDASEVLAAFFEAADPAAVGLGVEGARRLSSGERVVTLQRARGEAASDVAAASGAPAEAVGLTFVEFPTSAATIVLRKQFQELSFGSGFGGGHGGGHGRRGGRGHGGGGRGGGGMGKGEGDEGKLQDAGHIRWHEYEADFARLRYGKGEKAYDVARVNLSVASRCLIAYVRFPEGAAGRREIVEATLAAFRPPRVESEG